MRNVIELKEEDPTLMKKFTSSKDINRLWVFVSAVLLTPLSPKTVVILAVVRISC